jgi:hypothetical protein
MRTSGPSSEKLLAAEEARDVPATRVGLTRSKATITFAIDESAVLPAHTELGGRSLLLRGCLGWPLRGLSILFFAPTVGARRICFRLKPLNELGHRLAKIGEASRHNLSNAPQDGPSARAAGPGLNGSIP